VIASEKGQLSREDGKVKSRKGAAQGSTRSGEDQKKSDEERDKN
jgi:hypothetical protein